MAMLLSGKNSKIIEVSNSNYSITITGEILNERYSALRNNMNVSAHISIKTINSNEFFLKTITDYGTLAYNYSNIMLPSFFEDGSYQLNIEDRKDSYFEIFMNGESISDKTTKISNVTMTLIQFNSDVGFTTIDIFRDKKLDMSITIEVLPLKMDYLKDYKAIINEINEEVASLAFTIINRTTISSVTVDTQRQTSIEYLSILKEISNELFKHLTYIVTHMKHNIRTTERVVPDYQARKISSRTLSYLRRNTHHLNENPNGYILINDKIYSPTKVIEKKKYTTNDIYENQFVKYMIQSIIRRLDGIKAIHMKNRVGDTRYINFIDETINNLNTYLNKYFRGISDLKGNKSMSLVFQMAPGYKEFYSKYSLLRKGLTLGEDLFRISPKKIHQLYEMWCFMKIHSILVELGYNIEEYGIIKSSYDGMHLSLIQNESAKMTYTNNTNRLELWYNKSYSLPTTNQRPDNVLYIKHIDGEKSDRIYIFDAKYRVEVDPFNCIGPKDEDINVMHRYRDAIVSKLRDNFRYKYDTFGAYVMFPYSDEKRFMDHKYYRSIKEVNVGAFPMLPGSTNLIKEHLKEIINQTTIEANVDRIMLDDYDDYSKYKYENVMIVNVKDRIHLEAYKNNKFYHIPEKRLGNVKLGVEYLAFYQSLKSFGEDAGIKFYGKIKDIYKYNRSTCEELPFNNRDEIYLRFELEDVKQIVNISPIQVGVQIIGYTTQYLLLNAENMHELKLKSPLEVAVYKKLKSASLSKGIKIKKYNNTYILGDSVVKVIDDNKIFVNNRLTSLKYLEDLLL